MERAWNAALATGGELGAADRAENAPAAADRRPSATNGAMPGFPKVQPIDCATREPLTTRSLSPVEWRFQELVDGLYQYKWKSRPVWRDVCRRPILGFDDASCHSAWVRFT